MISFIINYWLEFLLISLTTTISCVYQQYVGIKKGMISLLKNEIIRTYEKYIKLGYCPSYMKENIEEMYDSYHKLGGKGMITAMVNEIYKLPSEITQTTNRRILPVGIVFENKTMYIANQHLPIYKNSREKLAKEVLAVIEQQNDIDF